MSNQDLQRNADDRHGGIQVIARAAAVMRTLGGHPQGLSLAAIAQQVNLPRSTVQRIIGALEAEGLVESVGPGGGFRLGPELGRLIYQTQIDIISAVRPLLEELSARLQESVVLCAAEGNQVVVIDRVVAESELRVVFPVGLLRAPMHNTAPGKALLAAMTDEQVRQRLADQLPSSTSKSRDLVALLTKLNEIRATGIAVEHGECREGVSGFAVVLDTYLGNFAIAAVMPTSRAGKPIAAFQQPLLECKQSIERKIGSKLHTP